MVPHGLKKFQTTPAKQNPGRGSFQIFDEHSCPFDMRVSHWGRLRAVSLFLENHGEESKTNEQASVTVSVMCEWGCREPLVVWASEDERKERLPWFHTMIWMLL